MTTSLLNKITSFVGSANYENLPEDMKKISKLAIIDTVGVALAGWNEPCVQTLRDIYTTRTTEDENASLWGGPQRVPLEYAALINGTATHALDFDDVTPTALAHPSAPIVAAIIPLTEYLGKSGKELITAYSIGVEVMIRVGQVMGVRHYDLGWHATSTLGTVGAASACGYLLQLTEEKLSNAIAIACSMAGGLQKNFGTMVKPLHVGLAAQHAIQATWIAKNGFAGNKEVFGTRGFFNVFAGNKDWEVFQKKSEEIRFGNPYDYQVSGLSVKKFPCCYATHRFIQGVLGMREEFQLTLDEIQDIHVLVPPGGLMPLIHKRPTTGLQGKFSAEYTCLAALEDGKINLQTFSDSNVQRKKIQRLLSTVKPKENEGDATEGQVMDEKPVQIIINMRNGEKFEKLIFHAPGSKSQPLSLEEYQSKWLDCLQYSFSFLNNPDILAKEKIINLFQQAVSMEDYIQIKDWIYDINDLFNIRYSERM